MKAQQQRPGARCRHTATERHGSTSQGGGKARKASTALQRGVPRGRQGEERVSKQRLPDELRCQCLKYQEETFSSCEPAKGKQWDMKIKQRDSKD